MEKPADKLWGGRFSEAIDETVEQFTASIRFDNRLYRFDIMASVAHAKMLAHAGVLSQEECAALIQGLQDIENDIARGDFAWSVALEDVHMNIEARLTERIGEVAKKLHTARSRNDQIATDMRLYLRHSIDLVDEELKRFQVVLLDIAERESDTVMPGFTHLQAAQPVTFGHHMMAWFEMLSRDRMRLSDCRRRVNVLPLGAAALAGTSFPIDREFCARELGFDTVTYNSLDAVSDRDFVIEFVAFAALLMVHLSRFSEELVLWSSAQFDFVDIPDRYCTGSSIMPQKKNPDVPELVRGKAGRVNGDLVALLTLMKGQVLAYNKDNQEDKEPLFDAVDTVCDCTRVMADLMSALIVKRERLAAAALQGYTTATDLADYLVRKGLPFRDAHEVVGRAVRYAIEQKKDLSQLDVAELKRFSPVIDEQVYDVLTLQGSLAARNHVGGTAPAAVRSAVERARRSLDQ